ncbi:MAG TPA: GNAT family N-acetyltransferase [Longimicrobiales bacterium]|nr:GNAT family N-acetyltransferase [Longimicrobiales bacterium]
MSAAKRRLAPPARDPGVRRSFLQAGEDLGCGRPTAGSSYSELVLDLLEGRDHGLLVASAQGRIRARAVVAARDAEPDTAILGLYEAADGEVGDAATARILDEAEAWARARGRRRILAPVDGSTWMAYRFRIPSLDAGRLASRRSYSWEPHHPERYPQRFFEAGYREALRFETLGLVFPQDDGYRLAEASVRTRPAAEAARDHGYRFEALRDHREAVPWPELHSVCSDGFRENPLFDALPLSLFRQLYHGALGFAAWDFTHWLRDPAGELCAVVFAFRQDEAVVVKSIAVSPLHRGRHLSTALIHRVLDAAASAGVHEIVSALVRSGNTSEFLSRRHLMPGVESWSHGFAVLGREVEP